MLTRFLPKLFIPATCATFLLISNLYGQPGTLDPTFGTGGKVISDSQGTGIQALVVQPDGKLVGAGYDGNSWMLTRYNSNGTLDNSFGINGIETAEIATASVAYGVALQSDGKIISAGIINNDQFFVFRNNTNGSPDNSFGTNGQVIVQNIINGAQANCVSVQNDGKIIAGGFQVDNADVQKFMLLRLNQNGTSDSSFGTNGIATTSIQSFGDVINALTIQADGKISWRL